MVEVWSNSMSAWTQGAILQVAEADTMYEGHKVRSGAMKVAYGADDGEQITWVQPDDIAAQIRKAESCSIPAPASLGSFPQGTRVDVWSRSKEVWILNGVVIEVASEDRKMKEDIVPKNSVKVSYKVRTSTVEKWITAGEVATLVRRASAGNIELPNLEAGH
uniref:Uncharacterized protein n=1 Tax=Noctiluca scintillans TaxID=2966 RepID=A0A7S1A4V5_NOCSC